MTLEVAPDELFASIAKELAEAGGATRAKMFHAPGL